MGINRTDLAGAIDYVDHLLDLFEQQPEVVDAVAHAAFEKVKEPMLDELQHTPGKVKYPIQWTSERQRRAFFATNGFGGGIPYVRTGNLAKAWKADYGRNDLGFYISVRNDDTAAAFVVGQLYAGARDTYQRMHRNTGWQRAKPTVDYWFGAYIDELRDGYVAAVREWVRA